MAFVGTINSDVHFRNRIINGDMRIDQRNAGASITLDGSGVYPVDRWRCDEASDGAATGEQVQDAPAGFVDSLKITTTTADATLTSNQYLGINQFIEGFYFADLGYGTASAKTFTLSFWVKSSLTGTFAGGIDNNAGDRTYVFNYTISVANTWEYKTITIAGDTSGTWATGNTRGLGLRFGLGAGTGLEGTVGTWQTGSKLSSSGAVSIIGTLNATWQITGVQLEVGSVATPFERRPYGMELALCQRYYYKEPASLYHTAILDGFADFPSAFVYHPVEMRATPTTVFEALLRFDYNSGSAGANFTPSGGTTAYVGNTRLGISRKNSISNAPASSNSQRYGQWDVQLSFSAEL